MKKVLFIAILSCYLLSMAIVPMNVGNKWYYYCERYCAIPNQTLKYCKTATVEKDTVDNTTAKKKVLYHYSVPYDSLIHYYAPSSKSGLWYEVNNGFYVSDIYYRDSATDSTYSNGYEWYDRLTLLDTVFCRTYVAQKISRGQGANTYTEGEHLTAKNLGIVYDNTSYIGISTTEYRGTVRQILVAAIIDGEYLGDSLATTSITEQTANIKTPILISNYPNPFNPTTDISFNLTQTQTAKLAVYNSRGELVRVLADQQFSVGRHSIQFNGAGLNSGVYFYQLESAGIKTTGKMIMLK